LKVCRVKTVDGIIQVVCGAPNARTGLKAFHAGEGTTIPSNGMVMKKNKIRDGGIAVVTDITGKTQTIHLK
jgi:phenylalanyl-tRNA synthetase beta chain